MPFEYLDYIISKPAEETIPYLVILHNCPLYPYKKQDNFFVRRDIQFFFCFHDFVTLKICTPDCRKMCIPYKYKFIRRRFVSCKQFLYSMSPKKKNCLQDTSRLLI